MTQDTLIDSIKQYETELIAIRHDIHRHPEVGFEETRTAALVADRLRQWGLEVTEGIAGTGVVATLKGRLPGQRAIGLRADLDALHIQEVAGRDHGSLVPGKMHACGHDGHTAMLLGAARYLAEHPDFGGTVNFHLPARRRRPWRRPGDGRAGLVRALSRRLRSTECTTCRGSRWGRSRPAPDPFLAASDTWSVTFPGHRRSWRGRGASRHRHHTSAGAFHPGGPDHRQPQRRGDRYRGRQCRFGCGRRCRVAQHHPVRRWW